MKRKKTLDGFNLSFMDCICCGFGAIILLFVLTVGPIKKTLETKKTGVQDYLDQITKALGILESQLEGDKAKIKKIESANTNLYSKEIIQTFEDLSELEAQISSILDRYFWKYENPSWANPKIRIESNRENLKCLPESKGFSDLGYLWELYTFWNKKKIGFQTPNKIE